MKKKAVCASLLLAAAVAAWAEGSAEQTRAPAAAVTPPGTFPVVKEPVTVRMLVVKSPDIEDLNTNAFARDYEAKTNVKVIWDQIPVEQQTERLNIIMASGDYPEVITGSNVLSRTQLLVYGSQGILLPLNDLIDKQMVHIKEMFRYNPEFRDSVTAPDGKIYAFPQVAETLHVTLGHKMWVYQPWLDALGIAAPTTTDEFRAMLIAFRDRDPNKNGKADSVPLAGAIGNPQTRLHGFLMNAFAYSDPSYLEVTSGKVRFTANTSEWRDGLRYLRDLYAEKLIAPESFTQNLSQLRQLGENPGVPVLGAVPALTPSVFAVVGGSSGRFAQYRTIAPLKGPAGVRQAHRTPYPVRISMVLTRNAKHPEVVARWLDHFFLPLEGGLACEYGLEGSGWERAKPGEVGLDGRPARWRPLRAWGTMQNIAWVHSVPFFNSAEKRNSQVAGPNDQETILYRETTQNYVPFASDRTVPPLFFTEAQALEMAQIEVNVKNHVDNSAARFIVGDLSLDRDWNTYVSDLERMGVRRYTEIHQQAYEAKYKR